MPMLSPYDRVWLDRALVAIAAAEKGPSKSDLSTAPKLNLWIPQVNYRGELVLEGEVKAHPILGDDVIITSPLIALDPDRRWARTTSRWYRLGQCQLVTEQEETAHFHRLKIAPPNREQMQRRLAVYIEHLKQQDEEDRKAQAEANH
ncbi:DUF6634 family protein [Sinirhodobacter huangdaonensis]|uniref:ATP-dependent Lon protease n=1 Tax=Paenirhodobacter huangdaonensis TaxID=2501515 RepID=A0A443LGX3_9RHOB|nr:DUF6634 family protein [Sinirhodobacter huangdaonensis]RWR48409.1 ATP-dependent Lon protease [Sinirhodobacter huangdaonensis]